MKKDEIGGQSTNPASESGAKVRILITDDKEIVRESLKSVLKLENDLEVVAEAADGQSALEMAERHRPDIVLMDISMPNMDGVETTSKMIAKFPDVKIIGLSLYDDDERIAEMRGAGAVGFLSKMGACENLAETIRKCYTNNPIVPDNSDG